MRWRGQRLRSLRDLTRHAASSNKSACDSLHAYMFHHLPLKQMNDSKWRVLGASKGFIIVVVLLGSCDINLSRLQLLRPTMPA